MKVLLAEDTNLHQAKGIVVLDDKGMPVPAQVNAELVGGSPGRKLFSPDFVYVVHFKVDLPPLGLRTYYVCQATLKQRLENNGDVLARFVPIDMYVVRRMSGTLANNKPKRAPSRRGGQLRQHE